jgi:hypothetical protein
VTNDTIMIDLNNASKASFVVIKKTRGIGLLILLALFGGSDLSEV